MKHQTLSPFVPLAGPATPAVAAAQPAPTARPSFVPAGPAPARSVTPAAAAAPAPAPSPAAAPAAAPAATPHVHHAAPRLTFEREGDRVTRILVHCACGEVIPVDCRYAESDTLSA